MAGVEQRQDLAVDGERIRPGWRYARRPRRRTAPSPRCRRGSSGQSRAGPRRPTPSTPCFRPTTRAASSADCETMLRLASVSLSPRSRAVQRASARAASRADCRSLTLDCSSLVSKRASTWPLVTRSPSRTSTSARRPATRPFTIVWSTGWVVPVKRTTSTRPRGLMVCSSAAISSIGRSPGFVAVTTAAALPEPLPFFQAKAPPASTTAAAMKTSNNLRLAVMAAVLSGRNRHRRRRSGRCRPAGSGRRARSSAATRRAWPAAGRR